MCKLYTIEIRKKMKSQFRILGAILFSVFILGCSNENMNSNQVAENDKINVNNSQSESKLFNELLKLTQNLNQFEGSAFVGALDGPCFMVLTKNTQDDKIAKLRYTINNIYADIPTSDKVDETYTITDFKRKSIKIDGLGKLKEKKEYVGEYFHGKVDGLKASINDGEIIDGSGPGEIYFILDSINYRVKYIMVGEGNWSFHGSVKSELDKYILLKEFFIGRELSENEIKEIYKSKEIIQVSSQDSNFISLGENKYKVLVSEKELVNNLNHPKGYRASGANGPSGKKRYSGCDSYIDNLFTLKIKNVSNKNITKLNIRTLFDKSMNSNRSRGFRETLKGSSLQYLPKNISFSDTINKEVEFLYNLVFHKPGSWWSYPNETYKRFKDMSLNEIFKDKEFLQEWEFYSKYPAITMQAYDDDNKSWIDIPVEIYFEFQKEVEEEVTAEGKATETDK